VTEQNVFAPPRGCAECQGTLSWEALHDGPLERWLGVCGECGWMVCFLPDRPGWTSEDPLRVFLLGPRRRLVKEAPAWVRLFRMTQSVPWNVEWRHAPIPCDGCELHACFHTRVFARPGVLAACLLCLACGRATVEQARVGINLREAPVVGEAWSPPDVGVARLRAALLRPYSIHGEPDQA
jgi:hypothetical protein